MIEIEGDTHPRHCANCVRSEDVITGTRVEETEESRPSRHENGLIGSLKHSRET